MGGRGGYGGINVMEKINFNLKKGKNIINVPIFKYTLLYFQNLYTEDATKSVQQS